MRNPAQVPSFEELQKQEKVPSFEELKGLEQPSIDIQGVEMGSAPIGGIESALRTARAAVGGATAELSEPFFAASNALDATLSEYLQKGDFDGAEKALQRIKENYQYDIQRQEQFRAENQWTGNLASAAGAFAPSGPFARLATAGKAAETIPQAIGQMMKTGAAFGAVSEAAKQIKEAPYTDQEPVEQVAKMAKSAGETAVAAPVVGAGLGLTAYGLGKVAPTVSAIATSKPVLRVIQAILGPKVETQQKFLQMEREIEALPDVETVVEFFKEVKDKVVSEAAISSEKHAEAKSSLRVLQDRYNEALKSAEGAHAEKLKQARAELKDLNQRLGKDVGELRSDVRLAKQQIREDVKPPELNIHAARVETAAEKLKEILGEKSTQARDYIDPEYRMPRSSLLQGLKDAMASLKIQGTTGAAGAEHQRGLNTIQAYYDRVSQLPDELNGQQIKDILQQLDADIWSSRGPFEFGKPALNALKRFRSSINGDLISKNTVYNRLMEQVRLMSEFNDEMDTLMPNADRIKMRMKEATKEPSMMKKFQYLERVTGIPVTEGIQELLAKESEMSALAQTAKLEATPEKQALNQALAAVRMARAQKYREAVNKLGVDPDVARQIIDLKDQLELLTDKTKKQQFIEEYMNQAGSSQDEKTPQEIISTAALLERNLDVQAKSLKEQASRFTYENPANAVSTILRNSQGLAETDRATKLIDAVSRLPDEQFREIFDIINLKDPARFEDFSEALRIRHAMSFPRTQGSRRVVMMEKAANAVASIAKLKMGAQAKAASTFFGAFGGGVIDEFGGNIAQAYLRSMNRLKGLPTYRKIETASPVPLTDALRNKLTLEILNMTQGITADQIIPVVDQVIPDVSADIEASQMSPMDKAKALNDLRKNKIISGKNVQKLMTDGITPVTKRESTVLSYPEPEIHKNLLERLSK